MAHKPGTMLGVKRAVTDYPDFNPADYSPGEVVQHAPPASERSMARRIALQILYEVDSAGHHPGSVMALHLQARQPGRKVVKHVQRLVNGVIAQKAVLDATIRQFAPEWPIEQMAIIDRNILRMAIYEFGIQGSAPTGAAIDEAVQLAKVFGAENTPGFINGVLGALAADAEALKNLRSHRVPEDEEQRE